MNVINVNGRQEVVGDLYEGIEVARDIMGESWYSFMSRELRDSDEAYEELDNEVKEYRRSEQELLEEYQGYLHEIQELAEQCMKEEVLPGPTTKRMQKIYEYLDAIKNICYKHT